MPVIVSSEDQLKFATVNDRLGTYVSRRNANLQNQRESVHAAVDPSYTPAYNAAAYFKPHARVLDYSVEANSGPKDGFRPCYLFDLDYATNLSVDVTVSGDITLPTPGSFSYIATGVNPTQPLAAFLAAVVAGIGTQTNVYFGVERDDTCLAIVGQLTYEIANVQVTIV